MVATHVKPGTTAGASRHTRGIATTVRGAERVLRNAQKNHAYVMGGDFPAWLRAAVLLRVQAAERQLRELKVAS